MQTIQVHLNNGAKKRVRRPGATSNTNVRDKRECQTMQFIGFYAKKVGRGSENLQRRTMVTLFLGGG